MEFTLALTHFCEAHGPKSVLCTQILPLECALCLPPSPPLRPRESSESLSTQVHDQSPESERQSPPFFNKTDTNLTLSTDFSAATTNVESDPDSPTIERHPLFKGPTTNDNFSPQYRYGRAQGETCASCSFSVPQEITEKLPAGAPGSLKPDGKQKNGAPVLRSREFVCLGKAGISSSNNASDHTSSQDSKSSSLRSFGSRHSHQDCHDHTLTYLTAKSPDDPEDYALLRASVIRTLSCELLPRGMSDGPFCFGDSNTGYTIAYVFRLTDPKARGRRRAYAFVALAGKDASRAFKACPMLWEAFATMAKGIEQAAQRHQDQQQQKEQDESRSGKRNYTPVSSFLTQRAVDPDGHPRRVGQTTPRSLAEIIGDEHIFTILHQYFVAMLRCLGDRFGGLPHADKPSVYQTLADEEGISNTKLPTRARSEMVKPANCESSADTDHNTQTAVGTDKIRNNTASISQDDIDKVKAKLSHAAQRSNTNTNTNTKNNQCAPLPVNESVPRPVAV